MPETNETHHGLKVGIEQAFDAITHESGMSPERAAEITRFTLDVVRRKVEKHGIGANGPVVSRSAAVEITRKFTGLPLKNAQAAAEGAVIAMSIEFEDVYEGILKGNIRDAIKKSGIDPDQPLAGSASHVDWVLDTARRHIRNEGTSFIGQRGAEALAKHVREIIPSMSEKRALVCGKVGVLSFHMEVRPPHKDVVDEVIQQRTEKMHGAAASMAPVMA